MDRANPESEGALGVFADTRYAEDLVDLLDEVYCEAYGRGAGIGARLRRGLGDIVEHPRAGERSQAGGHTVMASDAWKMSKSELRIALDKELLDFASRYNPLVDSHYFARLAELIVERHRRATRTVAGYRVYTSEGLCVLRRGSDLVETVVKVAPVSRAEAHRLVADCLDAGPGSRFHVRRVMRRALR